MKGRTRRSAVWALSRVLPAVVVAAVATGCSWGADAPAPAVARAAATITADEIRRHIAFLADDALRGRATPSPGLDSAVAYAARHLAYVGLRPGLGDSSFVQRYPFPLLRLDSERTSLRITGPAGTVTARYGEDYSVVPGQEARIRGLIRTPGLARRGGTAGAEVAGGAVILAAPLPGVPGSPLWLEARARRLGEAAGLGAAALLHLLESGAGARPEFNREVAEAVDRPARLLGGLSPVAEVFLAAEVLERAAGRALSGSALQNLLAGTPLALELTAPAEVLDRAEGANVIAVYPGRDPVLAKTYVVLSAHIDHLGVGEPVNGDSIYNGADDDASGVAALLELAQAFAALEAPTRRSVMFLAVSGEERGLLGSRWFLDHAPVPVDSMVANLNLDMIGRNSPDSIAAIGIELSSLGRVVREVAAGAPELGLVVTGDLWPEERFFFRSDHFQFAVRGVPALFLFAGTHSDYHRPSDHVERIDAGKAARVARLAFYTAVRIANGEDRPVWTEEGRAALSGGEPR